MVGLFKEVGVAEYNGNVRILTESLQTVVCVCVCVCVCTQQSWPETAQNDWRDIGRNQVVTCRNYHFF